VISIHQEETCVTFSAVKLLVGPTVFHEPWNFKPSTEFAVCRYAFLWNSAEFDEMAGD